MPATALENASGATELLEILAFIVTVAVVSGAAQRFGWPAPMVLLVVGAAASYIPGIPRFELNPELVLVGLLPPLLYAAAIRTSLVDFRANRRAIALLSVGLVIFTTLAVGWVTRWVLPGVGLAAALALGAVVAPPDAVAATAVARRVGMPRRVVAILEGESLVNDATALVALHMAIAALSRPVALPEIAWNFVLAAGGGVLVGIATATVLGAVRKYIEDPVLDTTLSFVAPFLAFLPAEQIHASGVLAVVITGLLLGHKSATLQSGASRLAETTNWATLQFLLENSVFLLIGLQARSIGEQMQATSVSAGRLVLICASVLLTVILARVVWVMATVPASRRRTGLLVSWAGMRGVVTLAAAFSLPVDTPQREVLIFAALTVVAGTLLLQGPTLPWLTRRLQLPPPDAAEDALQLASLMTDACRAGIQRLEQVKLPEDPEEVIDDLRKRAGRRADTMWERLGRPQDELEPPGAIYRRLRLAMLEAERNTIVQARDAGTADDEVLRQAMAAVDTEESMLDAVEDAQSRRDGELISPHRRTGDCEHLRRAPTMTQPLTPGVCDECVREGLRWVHLRMCLACGHVGCCDSSVGRHATGHYAHSEHPVMRSAEPGEAWRWCYVDQHLG